ncbi:hypothetical protein VTG60DRAFT_2877 [Thermothelomyces hinnuleus]
MCLPIGSTAEHCPRLPPETAGQERRKVRQQTMQHPSRTKAHSSPEQTKRGAPCFVNRSWAAEPTPRFAPENQSGRSYARDICLVYFPLATKPTQQSLGRPLECDSRWPQRTFPVRHLYVGCACRFPPKQGCLIQGTCRTEQEEHFASHTRWTYMVLYIPVPENEAKKTTCLDACVTKGHFGHPLSRIPPRYPGNKETAIAQLSSTWPVGGGGLQLCVKVAAPETRHCAPTQISRYLRI